MQLKTVHQWNPNEDRLRYTSEIRQLDNAMADIIAQEPNLAAGWNGQSTYRLCTVLREAMDNTRVGHPSFHAEEQTRHITEVIFTPMEGNIETGEHDTLRDQHRFTPQEKDELREYMRTARTEFQDNLANHRTEQDEAILRMHIAVENAITACQGDLDIIRENKLSSQRLCTMNSRNPIGVEA